MIHFSNVNEPAGEYDDGASSLLHLEHIGAYWWFKYDICHACIHKSNPGDTGVEVGLYWAP